MEKRGVVVGFASAVLAVGMAFGGLAIANAQESQVAVEPVATPAADTIEPMSKIGTAVADTPVPVVAEVPVVVAVAPEPVALVPITPPPASAPASASAPTAAPALPPVVGPAVPAVDPRPVDVPQSMTPWISPLDTTRIPDALCYGAPEGYTGILVRGLVPAADGRDCIPAPGFENGYQDENGNWLFS